MGWWLFVCLVRTEVGLGVTKLVQAHPSLIKSAASKAAFFGHAPIPPRRPVRNVAPDSTGVARVAAKVVGVAVVEACELWNMNVSSSKQTNKRAQMLARVHVACYQIRDEKQTMVTLRTP